MHTRRSLGAALGLAAAAGTAAWRTRPGAAARPAANRGRDWIGTWTASPMPRRPGMPRSITDRTLRQVVRVSIGGTAVRIRLSNEFGGRPVLVGAAHVALADPGAAARTVPGSDRRLTFSGRASAVLPPGVPLLSDPVALEVPALGSLAVSLHLPETTELGTVHAVALQTAHLSPPGNFAASPELPVAAGFPHRFFLTGVMVQAEAGGVAPHAVVAFGDSLTDGTGSTPDADRRYPDHLARRLHEAGERVAVLNQGIDGNRVLSDGAGASALARFDRDALGHPGVTHVVLLEGINDLGWPGTALDPYGAVPSAEDLIGGYRQLIARARLRGVRVIGCILTPFGGAQPGYHTPDKEARRQAVNRWIRTSDGAFDGVADLDAALRDPSRPDRLLPAYDSGDHLHPGDAGYRAMAEAVGLELLGAGGTPG